MVQRTRLWLGLGLFATAAGLQGCGPVELDRTAGPPRLGARASGEAGEGEGGEGEGGHAGHRNLATDDAEFLAALAMIEGHLLVATELYAANQRDAAMPHVKHPEDEIYGSLRPGLAARRIRGFEPSLTAMARTAESGASPDAVRQAFQQVQAELLRVRRAVNAPPAVTLAAVANTVRAAGDEYAEGVQGTRVVNAKEYHDAYGFVRVSRAWVEELAQAGGGRNAATYGRIRTALGGLDPAWPSLTATAVPPGFDEGRFSAVASNIALDAQDIR